MSEATRDVSIDAPQGACCTVAQGHDFNWQGVCLRGCGIPEDGFVHGLQRNIADLNLQLEKANAALRTVPNPPEPYTVWMTLFADWHNSHAEVINAARGGATNK